jgi:hypothetical protein
MSEDMIEKWIVPHLSLFGAYFKFLHNSESENLKCTRYATHSLR